MGLDAAALVTVICLYVVSLIADSVLCFAVEKWLSSDDFRLWSTTVLHGVQKRFMAVICVHLRLKLLWHEM